MDRGFEMRICLFGKIEKPLILFPTAGLMAVFFLVVLLPIYSLAQNQDDLVQTNETFEITKEEVQFIESLEPLRVMADDNFVPLSTYDAKEGAYHGISVDLLHHVADRLGVKYNLLHDSKHSTWSDKEDLLKNGQIDMLMPVSFTTERALSGIFTNSFYDTYYGAIEKNTDAIKIKDSYDLAAYRIGATKASAILSFIQPFVPSSNIIAYDTQKAMYQALRNGEIDIALQNKNVFREDRFNMGFIDLTIFHTITESPRKYGFYFKKSDTNNRLVGIINRYIAGVNTQRLISHYDLGEDELILRFTEQKNQQKLLVVGIFGLLVLLVLLSLFLLNHYRLAAKLKASLERTQVQQEELEKSQYLLKESQRAAFVGSYKIDFIQDTCEISEVLNQILGIDRNDCKDVKGWLDLVHPDDKDQVNGFLSRVVLSACETFSLEYKIIRKSDGEVRWIYSLGEANFEVNGNLSTLIGTIQDITERKQSENLLQESQRKYKLLAENVDDIIWTMNKEITHYTYMSPSVSKLGYTPEEFLSSPIDAIILPKYHEHIQRAVSARLQQEQVEVNDDYLGRWELKFLKKNGETVYLESLTRLLRDENGYIQGLLGVTRDITERKRIEQDLRESEERYQSILSASPDNITITDSKGQILMISPAGLSMFGYEKEADVLGDSVYNHLVPEDRERALSNLTLKAQGLLSGPDEYHGLRKDGSTFDVEVMSNFIQDHMGRPSRVVIVVRDITERKQAEQERKNMQIQLQQALKMEAIGTLAGGIAHDFNNILGVILGYAEIAKDDCPQGSIIASDLDEVILASNRAKDLVKQILAFSRQAETEKIPLRPATIVKETIKLLRSSLPTTIDIQQGVEEETGLILADPTQIHQILMNLCTNAYHAMEETGGILSVSLTNKVLSAQDLVGHPYIQPGTFIELSVGDTGHGISPEIQEKIFNPYFTTKEVGKGTGMGLAIVHGIVKSYGGFVTCLSRMGKGTVFHIILPVIEGQTEIETKPTESISAGTDRILLVDDERILAEMARRMLERMGYAVTVRTNSIEALTTFRNQSDAFDLVITDQTMPGITGIDLARRMLQIRPDLPIILCTGYSSQITEEKVRSYGIKGFAMKPLSKNNFTELIRKILDEQKSLS